MKYRKEERLEIGRRIYQGELTVAMAAKEYDVNLYTARDYLRLYKSHVNAAAPREPRRKASGAVFAASRGDIEKYERMTREELIDEIITSKINEARAKKGYEVKGGGRAKAFRLLDTRSLK